MAKRVQLGRYGENPHQTAWSKRNESFKGPTVLNAPLHGSPLGYNNIRDANAALEVILDFPDTPAVAVLKHMNPCGLATGSTLAEAFENAWLGDEISAYGSIIGYSGEVDEQTFKKTIGKFVEVVVAPSYTDGALKWIRGNTKKSGLRVIPTGSLQRSRYTEKHTILGGEVSQTSDNRLYLCDSVEELFEAPRELTEPNSGLKYQVGTVTEAQLDSSMAGLVEFSIIAGKHTKSNAIILAYEYEEGKYRMLGMGAGQPNRMDSGEKLALPKANENMMRQFFRE
ncbi:MAG: hypothetical protein KKG59_05005, partial [Nanoarchaeota archaeon]|nr:hypothetical protein [Nanoarchaeota archaeon]